MKFRAGSAQNTAVDVDVPADEGERYEVGLVNDSKVTAVSVHVKRHDPHPEGGGTDHYPEVAVFSVRPEAQANESVEWDLSQGGRVTCTLDGPISGGEGFTAHLSVHRL